MKERNYQHIPLDIPGQISQLVDNTRRSEWNMAGDWTQASRIFLKGGHSVKHRPACAIFVTRKSLEMTPSTTFFKSE